MSYTNNSAYMSLPIPSVGLEPGPDFATDINNCLTIIDQHDHTAGRGVPITPSGLNISSDLPIGGNNVIDIRSARFTPQLSVLIDPSDIGCLYEVGDDLYYNDGSGNNVRITQSGAVAGTPGSISNLVSPASASYSVGQEKFIFQSDANVAASLDCRDIILRNSTASSNGLTLSPPTAMGSSFALILPSLPAAQRFVTLDASGNFGAVWNVDNSSTEISSNALQVKAKGIIQNMLELKSTGTTVGAGGFAKSASCGTINTAQGSPTLVTNLSVTITSTGRPIRVECAPASASVSGTFAVAGAADLTLLLYIYRDGVAIAKTVVRTVIASGAGATPGINVPPGVVYIVDPVAAGTYQYDLYYSTSVGGGSVVIEEVLLQAYEL